VAAATVPKSASAGRIEERRPFTRAGYIGGAMKGKYSRVGTSSGRLAGASPGGVCQVASTGARVLFATRREWRRRPLRGAGLAARLSPTASGDAAGRGKRVLFLPSINIPAALSDAGWRRRSGFPGNGFLMAHCEANVGWMEVVTVWEAPTPSPPPSTPVAPHPLRSIVVLTSSQGSRSRMARGWHSRSDCDLASLFWRGLRGGANCPFGSHRRR